MTGQHARRYSRIREWRTGGEKPRHRKTEAQMFADGFQRSFNRMVQAVHERTVAR